MFVYKGVYRHIYICIYIYVYTRIQSLAGFLQSAIALQALISCGEIELETLRYLAAGKFLAGSLSRLIFASKYRRLICGLNLFLFRCPSPPGRSLSGPLKAPVPK